MENPDKAKEPKMPFGTWLLHALAKNAGGRKSEEGKMRRAMYMVEIATYGDGRDIMDCEAIRQRINGALNVKNATTRIAQVESGVVRMLEGDGTDVTDMFGCMNRVKYNVIQRRDEREEMLARYRKALDEITAIGPSATVDEYVTAVCRANAIVDGKGN